MHSNLPRRKMNFRSVAVHHLTPRTLTFCYHPITLSNVSPLFSPLSLTMSFFLVDGVPTSPTLDPTLDQSKTSLRLPPNVLVTETVDGLSLSVVLRFAYSPELACNTVILGSDWIRCTLSVSLSLSHSDSTAKSRYRQLGRSLAAKKIQKI